MKEQNKIFRFVLVSVVVLASFTTGCSKFDVDASSPPQTIFSVNEGPLYNEPPLFIEIDWSWANIITIQGNDLEDYSNFLGDTINKTVSPLYLDNIFLSSLAIPKISKDGQYLAFQAHEGDIYIASLGSIISHNYSISPESYISVFKTDQRCNLDWSSDSQRLASICLTSDGAKISLYTIMDNNAKDVYEYVDDRIEEIEGISWSTDETMLAFSLRYRFDDKTNQRSQTDLFIYHFDTGDLFRLSNTPNNSERDPDWYPGSEILTYTTTVVSKAESTDSELTFTNKDGSCIKKLLGITGFVYPSWSPDGSQLAYIANYKSVMLINTSKIIPSDFLRPQGLCN